MTGPHESTAAKPPPLKEPAAPGPRPLGLSPEAAALKPKPRNPTPNTAPAPEPAKRPPETGGPKGPEPTRFGDWERKGRCSDF